MSELTEEEYTNLKNRLTDIKRDALDVSGDLEEASSILIGVEDRTGTWAAPIHVEMGSHKEPADIIEEKARTKWEPAVEENRPVGLGMTSSEKYYCHGRVGYIQDHLAKLDATAKYAPRVREETAKVYTQLDEVSTQITIDPRTRHTSRRKLRVGSRRSNAPVASHRGLTPRQRRRR